jgi:hypothetical protein
VKRVPGRHGVSYGHIYTTDRETTLGLVPLGYATGCPGPAATWGRCSPQGAGRTVAGRVCMDQFVLDLGDDDVAVGDEGGALRPGDDGGPTAQDWADATGTISYEIVTRVGPGCRASTSVRWPGTAVTTVPMWGKRAAVVAGAAGVVAAGAAVGLAAERYAVGRSFRKAHDPRRRAVRRAARHRRAGDAPTDGLVCTSRSTGRLPRPGRRRRSPCVLPRPGAHPGQLALPAARPVRPGRRRRAAGVLGPARPRPVRARAEPSTRRSTSSGATCSPVSGHRAAGRSCSWATRWAA